MNHPSSNLSIYIHWPFCLSKCPYCDFNSHVRSTVDDYQWQQALLQELAYWHQLTSDRQISSIFFGGGTPSLMLPQTVYQIINYIHQHWVCSPNLEISIEANPTSIEINKFKDFKAAGINRASIGIQSLDDQALKFLGRQHDKDAAVNALKIATQIFSNYSFDLIYARPNQTWQTWKQELLTAAPYFGPHLSLYQLTIEPNTAFNSMYKMGTIVLPSDEIQIELYENTQSFLSHYNLNMYEISNYAKPHYSCQHNLAYWRYQDYLAIGPGSHGRLALDHKKYALRNIRTPEAWLTSVEQHNHGLQEKNLLDKSQQFSEAVLMGLRLTDGILIENLKSINNEAFDKLIKLHTFNQFVEDQYLEFKVNTLKVTSKGRLVLNYIIEKLLT